jgi:hypothetical protein
MQGRFGTYAAPTRGWKAGRHVAPRGTLSLATTLGTLTPVDATEESAA